jgi:ABC-type sulfate transport system permease component
MVTLDRKGFALTLDVTLAIFIFLALLALILAFASKAQEDPLPEVLMQKTSNDILALLQKKNVLQSFNSTLISSELERLQHPNFQTRLEISRYRFENGSFVLQDALQVNDLPAETRTTIAGKRLIIDSGNSSTEYYISINYFTWMK